MNTEDAVVNKKIEVLLVFIDESGSLYPNDPSSPFFVLGATCIKEKDYRWLNKEVSKILLKRGIKEFSKRKHIRDVTPYLTRRLRRIKANYSFLYLDKKELNSNHETWYNLSLDPLIRAKGMMLLVNYFKEKYPNHLFKIILIFDQVYSKNNSNDILKELHNFNKDRLISFKYADSELSPGIQVAHLVSGYCRNLLDRHNLPSTTILEQIKSNKEKIKQLRNFWLDFINKIVLIPQQ